MRQRPTALSLSFLALATACSSGPTGGTPPPPPPPPPAAVASVAVTPPQADLLVGATVQLSAQPRDAAGNALSGRTVTWESGNTTTATVNGTGLVTGLQPGNVTITATSEGRAGTAAITVTAPPAIVLTQVTPATLTEGQAATITGTGFSATAGENRVTIGGVIAAVTTASATSLTVTVPGTCLPKGAPAAVEVAIGTRVSNTLSPPITPAAFAALAAGQQFIADAGDFRCVQLDAAAGAERYLIGVVSTEPATELRTLTIEADVPGTAGPVAPLDAAVTPRGWTAPLDLRELRRRERWMGHVAATAAAWDRGRDTWQRLAGRSGPSAAPAAVPSVPGTVTEGQMLPVRVPTFGGTGCNQFETVTALVRRISPEAIFLEDQGNPAPVDIAIINQAAAAFTPIQAIDIDQFGDPGDRDGNGRIVIVITKEVNRNSRSALGFVSGGDALLTTACASSNEGEFFYAKAPDPTGQYQGGVYTAGDLAEDFSNLLAHEFAHIIQVARRRAVGGAFMASFMAEGLATAAQEIVGMQTLGLMAGGNYGRNVVYSTFGGDPRSFFGYVGDLLAYFGFDFAGAAVPGAPEQCTWSGGTSAGGAPNGPCAFGTRLAYGVTWSIIKQAIDRHHGGAAGQKAILRAFSEYTGAAGYAELETVLGRPLSRLLAEWAPSLYLDDRVPLVPAFQIANWNIRSVASAWNSPNAELRPRVRGFGDFGEEVMLRGGSTVFYEVSGANRPALAFRVRTPGQRSTPANVAVWAVRMP